MVRPSLATTLVVLLIAVLGLMAVAATQRASSNRRQQASATAVPGPGAVAPEAGAPVAPAAPQIAAARPLRPIQAVAGSGAPEAVPAAPPRPRGHLSIRIRPGHAVALHAKPRGPVVSRVGATTQFGSPSALAVVEQRGGWLGVTSTDLPNGRLGWLKARSRSFERHRTPLAIRIDLSQRRLTLVSRGRVVRRATVGIGRPGSETPTGRFAITDKIAGSRYGPFYGCCVLALSGHQTNTPAGWRGGDRLAIHGTDNPSSIGVPSSAGCLHAGRRDLEALMRRVPLGTPVLIRA
jgi:lipoprotein-anchoring transpeptidase ErfK/SrfK